MNLILPARGLRLTLLGFLLCAGVAMAGPPTFYASPDGNDAWSGTLPRVNNSKTDGPLKTLEGALEKSRGAHRESPGAEVRVVLRGGIYPLERPLILTPDDSGLVLAAYRHETPVLTGEGRLTGWRRSSVNPNLWEAQVPDGWRFHELFVNGRRKQRTRAPASGFFRCTGGLDTNHPNQLRFKPGDVQESWARDGGAELVVLQAWAQARNRIIAIDTLSNTASLAGDAFPGNFENDSRYYIENVPEALSPGQWRLDEQTGVVTYWPEAGEDMFSAQVTAPRLYDLAHLNGDEERPVHDIIFDGLVFAGTDWRLTGGSDVDPQAAVEVEAAVQARFAKYCTVERCRFTRLGGYALDFGHDCQNNKVTGCEMWDLGGGGVRLGDTDAGEALAGPNFGNQIVDNHIHHIGLVNAPAVGVLALLTAHDLVAHNEIDHTFYTAISVGWSWGYGATPTRDNIVEYNHLHDLGQGMLSDMGGVYTLGLQPGTIIRHNVIHDVNVFNYGGWGLYTDEGSSGIVLESNLVYRCQSAGFHQHYGETNLVFNNIFALNRECQLMRTRPETHLALIITNNILYCDAGKLVGGNWNEKGFIFDHNLYFDTRVGRGNPLLDGRIKWAKDHDPHFLFTDPLFVDSKKGDFRLRPDSPALPFGFHPLDLRQVGPRRLP